MIRPRNDPREQVYTPLEELRKTIDGLKPGEKILCPNTKEEILRTQSNLMKKRLEIAGADHHLMYIDALLIAEAEGVLTFRS
jgi:hypothetical protein